MGREHDRPSPQAYRDVFEINRQGASIFEDLIGRFSKPPVVTGGVDAVLQTYFRMGQRSVLDLITRQINLANGVQPTDAEVQADNDGT